MKVYLVRHGQCDSNVKQIYNYVNEDLNEKGIEQATELSKKKNDIDYDVIISSPLIRAKHTAEIINVKNKEIICDERLREREHGSLEGQSVVVTDREDYWNYYTDKKYGTEESIPHLFARVKEFLDELSKKEYSSVLIVAHSGVSKAFYAYFNGIPEDGKFLNLGLKNTEVKEYNLELIKEKQF